MRSLLIVVIIFAIFFLGFLSYRDQLQSIDKDSFCPKSNWVQKRAGHVVPGKTAIIIDTSDSIPPKDTSRITQGIRKILEDSEYIPHIQKLSLYHLRGSEGRTLPDPIAELCVPQKREDANQLYETPEIIDIKFNLFLNIINEKLVELISRDEADQSPILETMVNLIEKDKQGDSSLDSFLIVSDMLQNTSSWNQYDDIFSGGAEAKCKELRDADLRGVWVYYVDRGLPDLQPPVWPGERWKECLGNTPARMIN